MATVFNPPEHGGVSSVVFAAKRMDWMYVAEGGKLFRRPVKVAGVTVGTLVKLPKPPL
jgi:hypothetical protein